MAAVLAKIIIVKELASFNANKLPETPLFDAKMPFPTLLRDTASPRIQELQGKKNDTLDVYRVDSAYGGGILVLTHDQLSYTIKDKNGESALSISCKELFSQHGLPVDGARIIGTANDAQGGQWAIIYSRNWGVMVYAVSLKPFGTTLWEPLKSIRQM